MPADPPAKGPGALFSVALVLSFAIWGVCAAFGVGGQRKLLFREGRDLLSDFWMPRTVCSSGYETSAADRETCERLLDGQSGWADGRMLVTGHDRCYPAFAVVLTRPFAETWTGAWLWTAFGALVFGLSVWMVMSCSGPPNALLWLAMMLGMPVVFAFERGNPVWLSAAAVGVFLVWWNDDVKWKRRVAAVCLAVAAVMKVSPCLLGALYLFGNGRACGSWAAGVRLRWKEIAIAAGVAAALFAAFWPLVPGGFSGLSPMLRNAAANFTEYARAGNFGVVPIWRMVRVFFRLDCQHAWPGCMAVVRATQAVGLAVLVLGASRRDSLLLVGGMLLAAGNMFYYGALYLYPAFLLARARRPPFAPFLWFLVFCPLQAVFFGHSGNAQFCNAAVLALMGSRLFAPADPTATAQAGSGAAQRATYAA